MLSANYRIIFAQNLKKNEEKKNVNCHTRKSGFLQTLLHNKFDMIPFVINLAFPSDFIYITSLIRFPSCVYIYKEYKSSVPYFVFHFIFHQS